MTGAGGWKACARTWSASSAESRGAGGRLFGGLILFDKREKVDNAWFTACILHNMLHRYHGLDKMVEDADWVGSAGRLGEVTDEAEAVDMDEDSETPSPGFEAFRSRLTTHFTCAWEKKEVLWFNRADA